MTEIARSALQRCSSNLEVRSLWRKAEDDGIRLSRQSIRVGRPAIRCDLFFKSEREAAANGGSSAETALQAVLPGQRVQRPGIAVRPSCAVREICALVPRYYLVPSSRVPGRLTATERRRRSRSPWLGSGYGTDSLFGEVAIFPGDVLAPPFPARHPVWRFLPKELCLRSGIRSLSAGILPLSPFRPFPSGERHART